MLNKTPLNAIHHASGARMVDFGGWEMPLHYGSQIEEHHAVRRDAGMFDVSHMLAVDVQGADARPFLRGLLANNVDKLQATGKALYTCMLTEKGGVVDDLIVYYFSPMRYRLVCNASTAEKDLDWMRKQSAGLELNIIPRRDLAMIAVQGPNARTKTWQAIPGSQNVSAGAKNFFAVEFHDYLLARTGYTGEDGFEITLPAAQATDLWQQLAANGVMPAGLGARDTLRLEAGMNLYGNDMDESVSPLDAGLAWTVDLAGEREFIGRTAILVGAKRAFLGLLLIDRGVLRAHQAVRTEQGEGEITSGGFSPTLNQSIAFARLPRGTAAGEEVSVNVRDKWLKARTVKLPFVRHGLSMLPA
jgi:aminomethyltransferase